MLAGLRIGLRTTLLGAAMVAALATTGCVSSDPSNAYSGNFDREDAAKTRMSLGLTYLQNNNYTQAKKNLDKALEFNPRSADVQYAMAYYYQLVGDIPRAESYYEAAIDLAPNNGDIANSYGAFKCQNGQYKQAKDYFFAAINNRLYANAAQTYENLALCAQSQGELEEAIGYFNEALKHQPARGKSLFLLTELYVVSKQWDLAKATLNKYEKVARVTPDTLWLAYEIAKGQGDFETARGYGDMLVSVYPDNPLTKRYKDDSQSITRQVVKTVKSNNSKMSVVSNEKAVVEPVAMSTASEPQSELAPESTAEMTKDDQNTELSEQTAKIHVVKPGENLYRISLLHNIKMATLREWNNIDNTGAIIAGQSIWLVPPSMQED